MSSAQFPYPLPRTSLSPSVIDAHRLRFPLLSPFHTLPLFFVLLPSFLLPTHSTSISPLPTSFACLCTYIPGACAPVLPLTPVRPMPPPVLPRTIPPSTRPSSACVPSRCCPRARWPMLTYSHLPPPRPRPFRTLPSTLRPYFFTCARPTFHFRPLPAVHLRLHLHLPALPHSP
ncbi:hypothetical protein B0H11DRAFT_2226716 [Mycena galericulata]|nr:hypothetical protein B0H11DRAFT_2226716 [Mycena galericulata]